LNCNAFQKRRPNLSRKRADESLLAIQALAKTEKEVDRGAKENFEINP
jgi:hypothetical protein